MESFPACRQAGLAVLKIRQICQDWFEVVDYSMTKITREDEIRKRLREIPDEGGVHPERMDVLSKERFKLEQELAEIDHNKTLMKEGSVKEWLGKLS
jgi:hypothetical protein